MPNEDKTVMEAPEARRMAHQLKSWDALDSLHFSFADRTSFNIGHSMAWDHLRAKLALAEALRDAMKIILNYSGNDSITMMIEVKRIARDALTAYDAAGKGKV